MGESTSFLSTVWAEITLAVTNLMGNNYTALMLTIPVAGMVIGLTKSIFRSRRRG